MVDLITPGEPLILLFSKEFYYNFYILCVLVGSLQSQSYSFISIYVSGNQCVEAKGLVRIDSILETKVTQN